MFLGIRGPEGPETPVSGHLGLSTLGAKLSGQHSLFSVHMLFPQVFYAFIHGSVPQRERRIHIITLVFTIHDLSPRAKGSLITPITSTYSVQSRE